MDEEYDFILAEAKYMNKEKGLQNILLKTNKEILGYITSPKHQKGYYNALDNKMSLYEQNALWNSVGTHYLMLDRTNNRIKTMLALFKVGYCRYTARRYAKPLQKQQDWAIAQGNEKFIKRLQIKLSEFDINTNIISANLA